jgi:hypothetical protein
VRPYARPWSSGRQARYQDRRRGAGGRGSLVV